MRIKQARPLKKNQPYGSRDYFILLLRFLFSQSELLLFLNYDGDSSSKLNELRYLALNHQVKVHLLLKRFISSVFLPSSSSLPMLQCRLLILSSLKQEKLLALSQEPQFAALLEHFPFVALGSQGLFSQEPFFSLLLQPKGLYLLHLLTFLPHLLGPLWVIPWHSLRPILLLLQMIDFSQKF